jgi:hypothetical protein
MYAAFDSILVVIDGHGGGRDAAALAVDARHHVHAALRELPCAVGVA